MNLIEPANWANPPYSPSDACTEDDFTPAPLTCPHCRLFYKRGEWEIEQHGHGRDAEFVLWVRCSNCGGYIEREERHR